MSRTPLLALTDIADSIDRIEQYTAGLSRAEFAADRLRRDAVERCIEIISEARRRIPADLKARHPGIPWPQIAAIGNIFRHEYDEVSPALVWEVVSLHLPELRTVVWALITADKSPP